jgi:hypothetical protein
METPKQKEKMGKNASTSKKVTNLFEDMEYHSHNEKSYQKVSQKPISNNKKGKSSQKV